MIRKSIGRLAIAVAAAALTIPAFAPAATAAPHPKVPSLNAAAKVYPHLAGGSFYENRIDKVYGPGKGCNKTKRVKGATGTNGVYVAPGSTSPTGAEPGLSVIAYRLPSAAKAKSLFNLADKKTKKCSAGGLVIVDGIKDTKIKKLKVKLGDASSGYTVKITTTNGATFISNIIQVRKGKAIVTALVSSMDGKVPAVKKSLKIAQLAVKTAS